MADTKLKPGRKKTGGRKAGTPNRMTVKVKEAIMNAFEEVGGEKYLVTIAHDDPKTFCTLLGKILPAELNAKVDAETLIQVVTGIDSPPGCLSDRD